TTVMNGWMLAADQARAEAALALHQPQAALQSLKLPLALGRFAATDSRQAQVLAARAYAAMGDTTRARAMYRQILSAWSDADSGLPLVEQVRAEYGRLAAH
ncbi:MAG: hypothetical protein ACRD2D_08120, partial [Terriglobales bacterium]